MTQNNTELLPLDVKKALKELIQKSKLLASEINDEKSILYLQAKGSQSGIFFEVIGYDLLDKTILVYDINYFPSSTTSKEPLINRVDSHGLNLSFDIWLQLVSEYISNDNVQGFLNKSLDLLPKRNAITNIKKRIASLSMGNLFKKTLEILSWIAGIISAYFAYKTLYP